VRGSEGEGAEERGCVVDLCRSSLGSNYPLVYILRGACQRMIAHEKTSAEKVYGWERATCVGRCEGTRVDNEWRRGKGGGGGGGVRGWRLERERRQE